MKRLVLILATAGVLSMTAAAPALGQIGPHEHFFTPPGQEEEHQIARGTGECDSNNRALNNFHENVHTNPDHPQSGNIRAEELDCPS